MQSLLIYLQYIIMGIYTKNINSIAFLLHCVGDVKYWNGLKKSITRGQQVSQSNVAEVEQASWYATSLCNFSTLRSPNICSTSVVQFDAQTQLWVSCVTLLSTLHVFILHNSFHSNSLVLSPPRLIDSPFDPS